MTVICLDQLVAFCLDLLRVADVSLGHQDWVVKQLLRFFDLPHCITHATVKLVECFIELSLFILITQSLLRSDLSLNQGHGLPLIGSSCGETFKDL